MQPAVAQPLRNLYAPRGPEPVEVPQHSGEPRFGRQARRGPPLGRLVAATAADRHLGSGRPSGRRIYAVGESIEGVPGSVVAHDRDRPSGFLVQSAWNTQHARGVAAGRIGSERREKLDETALRRLPTGKRFARKRLDQPEGVEAPAAVDDD